jgi:HTH-type transcriptional regulator, sugar sensing transcriptional regulator
MSIEAFGFTRTQDVIFWALARRGSSTGYAIARDTGIARANVYHALAALEKRGLAASSRGHPAVYRAADATTCLAMLSAEASRDLGNLARRLGIAAAGVRPTPPEGMDQGGLLSRSEVVGEVSRCIAAARQEVLAVIGPWIPELLPLLDEARRHGVSVRAVSLGLPAPQGAIVRDVPRADLEAYWGGLPVSVVADRRHAVCGVLASDSGRGISTSNVGVVPFLRHLLRRELAAAAAPRVS